jgi:hypothetical protein
VSRYRLTKGSGNMPEYRVYIVGSDGHFQESVSLQCVDDGHATEQAEQLVDGHDVGFGSATGRSPGSITRRNQVPDEQFGRSPVIHKRG